MRSGPWYRYLCRGHFYFCPDGNATLIYIPLAINLFILRNHRQQILVYDNGSNVFKLFVDTTDIGNVINFSYLIPFT